METRRLHLRVGPNLFLPVVLKLHGSGSWFGELQLHELLAVLEAEVPVRLPQLIHQRATSTPPELVRGDTLSVRLAFCPSDARTWLVGEECDGGHGKTLNSWHVDYKYKADSLFASGSNAVAPSRNRTWGR